MFGSGLLKSARLLAFNSFLSLLAAQNSAAEQCDPRDFLKSDTVTRSSDYRLSLSYLNDIKQSAADTSGKSAGVSAGGSGGSYDEKDSYSESLSKLTKLNLDESQKKFLYASSLSGVGLEGYKACLKKINPFVVTVSDNAINDPVFSFYVYAQIPSTDRKEFPFAIDISNGTLNFRGKKDLAFFEGKIENFTASPGIEVKRVDKFTTTVITVRVGSNEPEQISIPGLRKFTLEPGKITSAPEPGKHTFHHHITGGGADIGPIEYCADVPKDSVVIPDTVNILWSIRSVNQALAADCGKDKTPHYCTGFENYRITPTQACGAVSFHNSTGGSDVTGEGDVVADIVRVVPVSSIESCR